MTAEELKALRARIGLTQEELAQKLGVARNTITRWEMGIRGIPEPVARLAQLLDVLPQVGRYLEKEVEKQRPRKIQQRKRKRLQNK
jgi:transcriptional regulator with XRE-family HTH domain